MRRKTILVSLMMVSLAFAGCFDDGERVTNPYEDVAVNMAIPEVEYREAGTEDVWDATIRVNKVTPSDARVLWKDIQVEVMSSTGEFLLERDEPRPDPGAYDTVPQGWYLENASDADTLDEGNELRITTMGKAFEGATLRLYASEELIGTATLPNDFSVLFPVPVVNISTPYVRMRDADGTTVWDVVLSIIKITPEDAEVQWEDVRMRVFNESGTLILHPQSLEEDPGDSSYGPTPETWYIETMGNTTMDAGDSVKLTGMDTTYEGSRVDLFLYGEKIGSMTLPTEFPNPPPTPTASLASPHVSQSTTNTSRWNVRIDINKITPKDEEVLWTEVKIVVKSAIGNIIQAATDLTPDPITGYDGDAVDFYYVETGGNTWMSASDGIKLTSVTSVYEGSTVELTLDGERFAAATLPMNFP